jgi:hypothetical protein
VANSDLPQNSWNKPCACPNERKANNGLLLAFFAVLLDICMAKKCKIEKLHDYLVIVAKY